MKTNEQAKQEAIKKAWVNIVGDEEYSLIKPKIDENGWLKFGHSNTDKQACIKYNKMSKEFLINNDQFQFRPFELSKIEKNNGWIRIEPDGSNLPTEGQVIDMYMSDGSIKRVNNIFAVRNWFTPGSKEEICTHYKHVPKELSPIY